MKTVKVLVDNFNKEMAPVGAGHSPGIVKFHKVKGKCVA